MLSILSIQDLLLVKHAELRLEGGLSVLTGETGAGKSILLNGLDLALGERADPGLVRHGAERAVVTAVFMLPLSHPAIALLLERDILPEPVQVLTLRRVLKEGGSRAYINDQLVSARLLQEVGHLLVEVHGQNAERGLLDPRSHLALVDLYGGHTGLKEELTAALALWRAANAALQSARERLEEDARDHEWLEHAVAELRSIAPLPGEEENLATARARMQKGAHLAEAIAEVEKHVSSSAGALAHLRQAARHLERLTSESAVFQEALDAVDRALVAGDDIEKSLLEAREHFLFSPEDLEATELRLFDLRGMARKYHVEVAELPALASQLEGRLLALQESDHSLQQLVTQEKEAHEKALAAAAALAAARREAAARLDKAVEAELPPLKLGATRFCTAIREIPLSDSGTEQLQFEIATNNSAVFGPLARIASGGELSRIILALKVVLSRNEEAGTLIFDEIDRGVGGATAAAIGTRLATIAAGTQVIVVTHSPQVAAAGAQHFCIRKEEDETRVTHLGKRERVNEISRMLSGASITREARAQARQLLSGVGAVPSLFD